LLRIAFDLVVLFVTHRNKLPTPHRNIKTAIIMGGFVSDSEENTIRDPQDYEAITRNGGRCHVCSRTRDVETQLSAKDVDITSDKDHMSMLLVTLARIRMKLMNLISCVVFPNLLLLLQTILSYLYP
jgi:hypothetical protein